MQKITYTDKVTNKGQSLSGKFTSADANEIKRVINENAQEIIENYALKAELIKVTAEYTPTTGTTIPTPIANLGWTWLLGGLTYTQSNGLDITVPNNTIAIASYDGSTWVVSGEIDLPEATAELKEYIAGQYVAGDTRTFEGKIYRANKTTISTPNLNSDDWDLLGGSSISTLPLWSYQSENYPYNINTAVRDADGVIYVSLVDNNTFPLSDETNWLSVGGDFVYEELGDLFKIIDADGNELASWDEKGLLRTRHARNSIEASAIEGLEDNLKILSGSQQADNNLLQFLDADDRTMGYIDANGVWNLPKIKTSEIKVIDNTNDRKITNKRFFKIQNVDMLEVNIIAGALPTDANPGRIPTRFVIDLLSNGQKLITLNVEAVVQGQGSAGYVKKGYTFDLYNDEWKSVDLAINELVVTDSFHVKAFWTDLTHTRDVGCNMLFYEIAKSRPAGEFFVEPSLRTDFDINTPDINTDGARWGTWGIPCVLSWSGEFFGLYTWRLKKRRENYKVNRDNSNHIFIENQQTNASLGRFSFADFNAIAVQYEFRSPRNVTPEVEANVLDFFTYARAVYTNNINLRETYQDHLVLSAWLDTIIHGEVVGHWDSVVNNVQYITYNGKHWQPLFTDGDSTMGNYFQVGNELVKQETGFKLSNKDIFQTIREQFLPELKDRYTQLRNNGTLSYQGFRNIFGGIAQKIPQEIYVKDYKKWGGRSADIPTMNQIYYYLQKRLEWLDTLWLNQ